MHDDLRAPLTTRLRRPALVAADVAVALLLAMPVVVRSLDPDRGPGVAELLGALVALPVAVRRIRPVPVFCLVLAASVGAALAAGRAGFMSDPFLAVALAVYPPALELSERWAAVVAGTAIAGIGVTWVALPSTILGNATAWALIAACLTVASWALGRAVHKHRRYDAMRRQRAAEEAVLRERLRVAREVHDLLAHGMSVIAVQAGVANHVIDSNPSEARRVLASIAGTSRAGLAELRSLMGTLRSNDGGRPADRRPAPGVDVLPELVERIGAAGVRVGLRVRGERRAVPPGIDLAAYRIVQESLTNVVRHAGSGSRCEVVVTFGADTLDVEVVDDGPGDGGDDAPPGHGLAGMRERVAIYGGTLIAGPAPGHGFRVAASLPLPHGVTQ